MAGYFDWLCSILVSHLGKQILSFCHYLVTCKGYLSLAVPMVVAAALLHVAALSIMKNGSWWNDFVTAYIYIRNKMGPMSKALQLPADSATGILPQQG